MRKRSGLIWLAAGVIFALMAGALAFLFILRVANLQMPEPLAPEVEVVVATRFIGVREVIHSSDVELRTAPATIVPDSAIRDAKRVVGQLAVVSLAPGEMILSSQVVSPTIKGNYVAFTMDDDQVAMAFPADDLMSRNNLLRSGDHVDVLFSIDVVLEHEEDGQLVTFNALQDLEIAAIVRAGDAAASAATAAGAKDTGPRAIVFALDPQDALVLKHLKDVGGTVDIVLRAPGVDVRFDTQPVHMDYLIDRYELRIPIWP